MKRMRPCLVFLFAVLFCLPSGLFAAGKKTDIREPLMVPLIPHALIRRAGWTYNWQISLPVKARESIERMQVYGDYLYVLTDSNILFCVQRRQGRMLYSVQVSPEGLPVCDPFFYGDRPAFISGNQIRLFDPATGVLQQAQVFEHVGDTFQCGVARNENYIYLTGSDNRLHAISTDGYWQAFTATADNDSPIHTVIATDEIVVFATYAGNVVGMQPDAAVKVWQYNASGPIHADIVSDGEYVYVTGMDAKLYKLNIETGTLAWHLPFHAGAPLPDAPVIGNDVVYVYSDLNGLDAVNKTDGEAVWNLAAGKNTLCEAADRAFVYALPGIIAVMDNQTGEQLYAVNVNQVQRYAQNMTGPVMYVADKEGRLMSITVE